MKHLKRFNENKDVTQEVKSSSAPSMLFTDVVGSSKLWSDDAVKMDQQLSKHFDLISKIVEQHDGFIVKTIGDAFMIYFDNSDDSLLDAIKAGIEIIEKESLPLRIGICYGNMRERTQKIQNANLKDYFGNTVNTASRMESKVAEPGGIAFSFVESLPMSSSEEIVKLITNYDIEKISFTTDCSKDKEEIQGKRSGRLLSDIQINKCMEVQQLKGVKGIDAFRFKVK